MKHIKFLLPLSLLVAVFVGCKNEDVFDNVTSVKGEGQINPSSISLDIMSEALSTRSVETPEADDFTIEIFSQENPEFAVVKSLYKDLPEVITIPVGTYTLKAFYGDPDISADFDAPYFYGESDAFTIEANKIIDLEPIECKPANVKVSIIFDQSLLEEMSEESIVVVKVGKSGELTFDATTEAAGYFKYDENSNTLAANFVGTVQGEEFNVIKTYNDVQPGYYYQITFKLNVIDPSIEGEENTGGDSSSGGDVNTGDQNSGQDPGNTGDPENPSTKDPASGDDSTPGNNENNNSSNVTSSNTGALSIDASVIYTINTAGGEESLDPEKQEYLVDGSSWDYAGDNPFKDDDVVPDQEIPDVIPDTPTTPEDPNQGNGSETENPSPSVPETPVLTLPQIVSEDVNLSATTDISSWPEGKRLEIKILSNSPIKKFICDIDSETLTPSELKSVGLTDHLDLVNENEFWPTLQALGFPVGEDVVHSQEVDADGYYVIHFSLTNGVNGSTFVTLLNALGKATHKFIFHVENEVGESTATLALKS